MLFTLLLVLVSVPLKVVDRWVQIIVGWLVHSESPLRFC